MGLVFCFTCWLRRNVFYESDFVLKIGERTSLCVRCRGFASPDLLETLVA